MKPARRDRSGARKASKRQASSSPSQLDDETPRYIQLITHFRERILSGDWELDRIIPTREELAAEYDVGRNTVRQALSFLEREGLIASRRGIGTTVVRRPKHSIWFELSNSFEGLVSISESVEGELLDLGSSTDLTAPPDSAGATLAPGYDHFRRLLKRDGIPYLIGSSYIDRRIIIENDVGRPVSPYRLIERARAADGFSGEQNCRLLCADVETAILLEIELNSPVISVLRWIYDKSGTLVCHSEATFRSDIVQASRTLRSPC